jgi:glycosyltransferase involved in cell wall biosynthesis
MTQKDKISIAVVIPVYNIEAYVARAIQSVLHQTRSADEIIVVDDGSTDGSAAAVQRFSNEVKYIQQNNQGLSAARNTGIRAAASQWIAFLDGDDDWPDSTLKNAEAILGRHPDLVWVTGNYHRCSIATGKSSIQVSPGRIESILGNNAYHKHYHKAVMSDMHGCANTMIVKKWVFDRVGLFDTTLTRHEDLDMWLRIAHQYPQIGYARSSQANYYIDRPGSLLSSGTSVDHYIQFIHRQLQYADEFHHRETFQPVACYLLRAWIRSFLFSGRGKDVRTILREFRNLLPIPYVYGMRMLAVNPGMTAFLLRWGSKIARATSLYRSVKR